MTEWHKIISKHARLYQIFTKHVVSVCQFALEFANPLGPQYTRDFKIKVFMGLFHNFDAASFKQFHKEAIYSEVQGLQLGLAF